MERGRTKILGNQLNQIYMESKRVDEKIKSFEEDLKTNRQDALKNLKKMKELERKSTVIKRETINGVEKTTFKIISK